MFSFNFGIFTSKRPKSKIINALRSAIEHADLVKLKLQLNYAKQAGLNSEDLIYKDYSFLHYAILKTRRSNEDDMIEVINELNQLIDVNKPAQDTLATTPLHSAARRGLTKVVTWLLEHNANLAQLDNHGRSTLIQIENAINEKQLNNSEPEIMQRLIYIRFLLNNAALTPRV